MIRFWGKLSVLVADFPLLESSHGRKRDEGGHFLSTVKNLHIIFAYPKTQLQLACRSMESTNHGLKTIFLIPDGDLYLGNDIWESLFVALNEEIQFTF